MLQHKARFFSLLFGSMIYLAMPAVGQAKIKLEYQVLELASGLDFPWSMAFLDKDKLLITEKTGKLRLWQQGNLSEPIRGLPKDILVKGQGGLHDVVLHPNYAENGWIYLSYAAGTTEQNALTVVRAKLEGLGLVELQQLFQVKPFKATPVHYGGRMAFLPDNSLMLTSGDGFDYREDAQRLDNLLGKIIRINDDGTVPKNNPFVRQTESDELRKYVLTYGHRNPQAILFDPVRQQVFSHEHGPAGGDEVNLIQPGLNYGWPVITYGRDYSGASISPFKTYPGMQQPIVDWTPSIAPSAMALYQGDVFPQLQGDLLVSTLKSKEVRWLVLEGEKVVEQQSLFTELDSRIRDVRVYEGEIYLLLDGELGKLLKITSR